eukprot:s372_g11.t1
MMVAAGAYHTVILQNGRAFACGCNNHGQCAIPTLLPWLSYVRVAAGKFHTVLLQSDGQAVACGQNAQGQCSIPMLPAGMTYVDATDIFRCFVELDTRCCSEAIGMSSPAAALPKASAPCPAAGRRGASRPPAVSWGWEFLFPGDGVSFALLSLIEILSSLSIVRTREVGLYKSLGLTSECTMAVAVRQLRNEGIQKERSRRSWYIAVAAGQFHTLLLCADGNVLIRGLNNFGQCGAPALKAVVGIAAGTFHSILLQADGTAVISGLNDRRQADVPTDHSRYVAAAAGAFHTVLLRDDGCAVAFGENSDGQCDIPPLDEGLEYLAVAAGSLHTVLLRSDGCTIACGSNCAGQTTLPKLSPPACFTNSTPGDWTVNATVAPPTSDPLMLWDKRATNTREAKEELPDFPAVVTTPPCEVAIEIPEEVCTHREGCTEGLDGWTDGRMHACMDGRREEGRDGCMHVWMDGWMDGRMDGWTDGWMDGCLHACTLARLHACTLACLHACMDGRTDRRMDGWSDHSADAGEPKDFTSMYDPAKVLLETGKLRVCDVQNFYTALLQSIQSSRALAELNLNNDASAVYYGVLWLDPSDWSGECSDWSGIPLSATGINWEVQSFWRFTEYLPPAVADGVQSFASNLLLEPQKRLGERLGLLDNDNSSEAPPEVPMEETELDAKDPTAMDDDDDEEQGECAQQRDVDMEPAEPSKEEQESSDKQTAQALEDLTTWIKEVWFEEQRGAMLTYVAELQMKRQKDLQRDTEDLAGGEDSEEEDEPDLGNDSEDPHAATIRRQERLRRRIEQRWAFPDVPGRRAPPGAIDFEALRAIIQVYKLEDSILDQVEQLRDLMCQKLRVSSFQQGLDFEKPCFPLILRDVTCDRCCVARHLDVTSHPHRAPGLWVCENCNGVYNKDGMEARLVDLFHSTIQAWHSQEIKCSKCRRLRTCQMQDFCECFGRWQVNFKESDFRLIIQILRSLTGPHSLHWLRETLESHAITVLP